MSDDCQDPDLGRGESSQEPYSAIAILDDTGSITLCSHQVEALLGYRAEEVCGTPAVDFLALQEDRAAALAALERHGSRTSWDGVLTLRHRDGHQVPVALRVCQLVGGDHRTGWSVSAADARQVERNHVDRATMKALFRQSPVPTTVVDRELRYSRVNAAAESAVAVPAEQLVGRRIGENGPDIDAPAIEEVLRRVRDTGEPAIGFHVRGRPPADPDREHVWSGTAFRLTDSAGRLLGMCQTYVDITDGYRAQRRLALLTEASERIGTTLDVARNAQELADVLVPAFGDLASVELAEEVLDGDEPPQRRGGGKLHLLRTAVASATGEWPAGLLQLGDMSPPYPDMPALRAFQRGAASVVDRDEMITSLGDPRLVGLHVPDDGHSAVLAPLFARGLVLGAVAVWRTEQPEPFTREDSDLLAEVASRAAVCVDNARRYTREHATALALQRSLLPHDIPDYPAVETESRYWPAAAHAGAGGDWFDVLPLSGTRVALVVGEVIGHGLHAAAVMGRLRTAVRTLADLDLDPDEVLTQLDDLVIRLAEEDPACQGATCLYAVYDPVTRNCTFARAGHPPPVLVGPDGAVELLDLPAGPLLGVGGLPFETADRRLAEGTVLALYTNGLLETAGQDLEAEMDRLAHTLAGPARPLRQLCEAVVATLTPDHRIDATLLLARTRALAEDKVASWELPVDPSVVSHARSLTDSQLAAWDLDHLAFTTDLMVSELVTNAIRHARGPVMLRLIHADSLICEVTDGSLSAPHLRRARTTDEGGRGLFLVAQLASRWGTRYDANSKTIWAEQPTSSPESHDPAQ